MPKNLALNIFLWSLIPILGTDAATAQQGSAQKRHVSIEAGRLTPSAEVRDCAECPPMVAIPSPLSRTQSLIIARHELTWKEYIPSVEEASCPLPRHEPLKANAYPTDLTLIADDLPLTGISPLQIGCYLNWLNSKTGKLYRLPTAEEWVHAARAGTATTFPWGDEIGQDNAAIFTRFSPQQDRSLDDPRPFLFINAMVRVESFQPNAWGLYDVVGNVEEYVADTMPWSGRCVGRPATHCHLQQTRGGGMGIIAHRIGQGTHIVQSDPIGTPDWRMVGFAQPVGYRLVRN